MDKELIENIKILKKQKNAVILVHNYQRPEIYEVGDFIGDSLELCRKAASTKADVIVFCGVDFMAQSAKILNPKKIVLLPLTLAKCPMAAMVTSKEVKKMRKKYPGAAVVSYVNTTAEVKAESDVCCTSANAVKIVRALKEKEIIFTPDRNLGAYVQNEVPEKNIILLDGYCYVHDKVDVGRLRKAKKLHPNAVVLVHPECRMEVIREGHHVCSTSQMITKVKESSADEFIIVTECDMINRLKMERADAKYYSLGGMCLQMKKITLENTYSCLVNKENNINISKEVMQKAKKAMDKMLEIV